MEGISCIPASIFQRASDQDCFLLSKEVTWGISRMMIQVSKKPTLEDLRHRHYFDISALAGQAGVERSVIQRMLSRQPVQTYQAELVLAALTDEFGEDYTLDTVDIVLSS